MKSRQPARRLIVSIHDVAPPFLDAARETREALAALGVHRCVWKVVPNWHGVHPLPEADDLVGLLRGAVERGDELVLHGCEHREIGALRGAAFERARAAVFAPGIAEFLCLDEKGAAASVARGLALFTVSGLPKPAGFCAPGWLLSREAAQGVQRAGMRRCVGMFVLHDLATGRSTHMPGFGNVGGGGRQGAGMQILSRIVAALALPMARVAKAYLHPQGGTQSAAMRWTLYEIGRLIAAGWQPVTYGDLSPL